MTRAEAKAEALRRWGRYSWVREHRKPGIIAQYGRCFVAVTWRTPAGILLVSGRGETWEAAFADADERHGVVRV